MKNFIKNLYKFVDFDSYSSSLGYQGYFCCKGKYSLPKVDDAINIFHKFWKATNNNKLLLASTLTVDCSIDSLASLYNYRVSDVDNYIMPLIEIGIVRQKNPVNNIISSNGVEDGQFILQNIEAGSVNYLNKVLYVIMALGGVYGHFFIFFEEAELIVYPHDDIGFGLISMSHNNEWVERLFSCVDDDLFEKVKRK